MIVTLTGKAGLSTGMAARELPSRKKCGEAITDETLSCITNSKAPERVRETSLCKNDYSLPAPESDVQAN